MRDFYQLRQFPKYLIKARGLHRLHSPFFFSFFQEVILNRDDKSVTKPLLKRRNELIADKTLLEIEDFGAGSSFGLKSKRSIAEITRHTAKSPYWLGFLHRLSDFIKCRSILELGTGVGLSTLALASGKSIEKVVTIEGSRAIAQVARENFKQLNNTEKIELINARFDDVLPPLIAENPAFDLVFIDGNHSYQATINYFKILVDTEKMPQCVVIDDIYWSAGMHRAWNEIRHLAIARQSIDLFRLGLIFLNQNQASEHKTFRMPLAAFIA